MLIPGYSSGKNQQHADIATRIKITVTVVYPYFSACQYPALGNPDAAYALNISWKQNFIQPTLEQVNFLKAVAIAIAAGSSTIAVGFGRTKTSIGLESRSSLRYRL